jgi:type VI secretion system protein ImpJ
MTAGYDKVIWAEGILLGQQHFQQWEKFQQCDQQFRRQLLAPEEWGLIKLEVAEQDLISNKFIVRECQLIYSNGLLVNYQAAASALVCQLPENYNEKKLDIYLGVPINEQAVGITGYQLNNIQTTWLTNYLNVADIYDQNRTREVLCAKLNLKLIAGVDSSGQYRTLKIAELIKNENNQFILDKTFIPASMLVQSSPYLVDLIAKIISEIHAKWQALVNRYSDNVDLVKLIILQILSSSIAHLSELKLKPCTHPRQIFSELRLLAANLMPFTNDDPKDIPQYRHEYLSLCFSEIEHIVRKALSAALPTSTAKISLIRKNDTLYCAENIDNTLLQQSDFFIAVYNPVLDTKWIDHFAQQIKVGCCSSIDRLIASAIVGVRVSHIQHPPAKLTIKPGYEYFYLEPFGVFWNAIKEERSLAVFLPTLFKDATVELVTTPRG